jgi:putative tryptophan/tyrosine transport system substrate-binding protein
MRRRELIASLGAVGAYAAVPRLTLAQQNARVRRLALLMQVSDAPAITTLLATLRNELARLGWVEGHNLRIDLRFGDDDPDRMRANAAELVGLAPDVIVVNGSSMVAIAQRHTQTIRLLFTFGKSGAVVPRPQKHVADLGYLTLRVFALRRRFLDQTPCRLSP